MATRSKPRSKKRAVKKRPAKKASPKKSATVRSKAAQAPTPVEVDASERYCPKDAVRMGDVPSGRTMEITITLRGPKLPDIDTPRSASRNLVKSFGASKSDADKVSRVLRQYGLSIDAVSLDTRSMQVSGTVAQMEDAFRPNLGLYKKAGEPEFRDREGKYAVPPSLTKIITSVLGFGERRVAQRRPARARKAKSLRRHAFAPADIEDHYRFPPGRGAGEKIAIAEFGGGYFAEDLLKYCRKFGRAVPKVTTIGVGTAVLNTARINRLKKGKQSMINDTGEVMMDVEVVAGLCPEAEISVYFAKDTQKGWVDLIQCVIAERPVALSISWGAAEDADQWTKAARTAFNHLLQLAALHGITVCCAAGDDGSGDMINDRVAHVDFPSSSPFALAVGGTMITRNGGKPLEQVWREGKGRRVHDVGGATGGGVSTVFRRRKWQNVKIKSVNVPKKGFNGRVVPDISALAGPPFYDLIFRLKRDISGGTSASAPLLAALMARVNALLPEAKRQRCLTPLLYRKIAKGKSLGELVCNDITVGNNISVPSPGVGYEATKGFDAASGWGTPIGKSLLLALQNLD